MEQYVTKYFQYEPVDIELIRDAYNKAFDTKITSTEWRVWWDWSFGDRSMSDMPFVAYIENNKEIAAFIGVTPKKLLATNGYIINSGIAVSGFTHPDYQGQGIYSQLYDKAMPTFAEWGLDCLLAFDNHNSHYPEVKRLGWQDVGILTEFAWTQDSNRTKRDDISNLVQTGELSVEVLSQVASMKTESNEFKFLRDFEYLKWRLLDHPSNIYHYAMINANNQTVVVIFKYYGNDSIDVMEIFYSDLNMDERWKILQSIVGYFKEKGIDRMNIWSSLKTEEHLQLEKMGFIERQFSAYFVYLPLKHDSDAMSKLSNWHYRFLDSDVY